MRKFDIPGDRKKNKSVPDKTFYKSSANSFVSRAGDLRSNLGPVKLGTSPTATPRRQLFERCCVAKA